MAPNYYNPYQYPMQSGLRTGLDGRMVTNIEEARAAQINLDGSIWYFPSPSEGKIYTKSINMQGMPVFLEYSVVKNVNNIEQKQDNSQLLLTLNNRIEQLEKQIREINNGHNATSTNDTVS